MQCKGGGIVRIHCAHQCMQPGGLCPLDQIRQKRLSGAFALRRLADIDRVLHGQIVAFLGTEGAVTGVAQQPAILINGDDYRQACRLPSLQPSAPVFQRVEAVGPDGPKLPHGGVVDVEQGRQIFGVAGRRCMSGVPDCIRFLVSIPSEYKRNYPIHKKTQSMDFDQLRTFDRVVRDGSFTRAAARLNVTQATVSMRIKALEDAVGGALFLRGRNVRLTDVGISFLPYCRRMLGVMQEAREALKRAERGRVAIGTLSTMIMPLVSRALLRFQRRHAGVDVIVRDGRHTHVATMLHEREVDLAVMCWPNIDPLLTHLEPLFVLREDLPLVAAPAVAERIGEAPDMLEALRLAPRFLNLRWWQIAPARMTSLTLAAPACVELPTEPGRYLVEAGGDRLLCPLVCRGIAGGGASRRNPSRGFRAFDP